MRKSEMQSLPIDEFLTREKLTTDVYLGLGPEKFVLVAKAGAPSELLRKYKDKQIDRAYIRLSDYFHWIHQVVGESQAALEEKSASPLQRISQLEKAMTSVYQEISDLGMDETIFSHVKMVNHMTLSFLGKNDPLLDILVSLEKINDRRIKNATFVSMISAMLGVAHQWTKPGTIEKLSLAGFLHDIGTSKLPKSLLDKPKSMLTKDELVIYKSHPEVGNLLLVQIKTVPDDVRLAVWEHHERSDGSGFPRALRDVQISPFARILAIADAYAEELESVPDLRTKDAYRYAYERIIAQKEYFNRDAIKAFHTLFNESLRMKATG